MLIKRDLLIDLGVLLPPPELDVADVGAPALKQNLALLSKRKEA